MCGRYAATRDPAALAVEFDAVDATAGQWPGADYNVAPTKQVLSVVTRHPRNEEGRADPSRTERSIRVMRWGLVPHWAKDPSVGSRLINARAESAAEKPAFRRSVASRRCLLPADGWYEWQKIDGAKRKQPYFLTPSDGSVLALAGLWSTWRAPDSDEPPLVTCTVVTTDAVGPLAEVHDRMPLALPREAWARWLDPDVSDVAGLLAPSADLVHEMELRPVSTEVNDVRHAGPSLVERLETATEQPALLDLDAVP